MKIDWKLLYRDVVYYVSIAMFITGIMFAQPLTVDSIKKNLVTRFDLIEDYTVNVKISVDMTGFRMPRKRIKLYYKAPDNIKVESRGFAIVPKTGLGGSPTQFFNMLSSIEINADDSSLEQSKLFLIGDVITDSLDIPMSEAGEFPNMQMILSVDTEKWIITQVSAVFDSTTIFDISSEYTESDGFYLPKQTIMTIQLKSLKDWSVYDPVQGGLDHHKKGNDIAEEMGFNPVEGPLGGTITMDFSRYRVNRGLKDKIFEDSDW